ncbi:BZ3500_MvSof-1268-A1-R1_Chr8-2g10176 [Microbotryum saponariae]|uniref:BZ3500_MvSof-1268-A1-R1_Chr8-2g10176 protein n=1 Tax=Microbotryum saponariae TaxID=289078 RepID=A0A2X0LBT4_9BASI|nr:BZ3500_MvSof-1268-A1-R1_Chr8-2g10176 [Microbotryum saponariae]SDA01940.1 BZ3501_MvSof-1269-A2-R1_Chr8-2g09927 [Microbotryum saponariae]
MPPVNLASLGHQTLFRAPHHPWPGFVGVDDQVRGGVSTSSFTIEKPPHTHTIGVFSGHLDIKTLGGAGFASQSAVFRKTKPLSLPRSSYSGLLLTILRPSNEVSVTTTPITTKKPSKPTSFVLTLKSSPPVTRPDGRMEAGISYEYAFKTDDFDGKEKQIQMEWDGFIATYRGRADKNFAKLDPNKLYELSFMCRSNFGEQAGDFELKILELAALRNKYDKRKSRGCFDWAKKLVTRRYEAVAGWYKRDQGVRLV